MAQTAVSWFIEQLEQKGELTESPAIRIVQINIDTSEYLDLKRQAKAMEKDQIVDAVDAWVTNGSLKGEQYYKKTYNK